MRELMRERYPSRHAASVALLGCIEAMSREHGLVDVEVRATDGDDVIVVVSTLDEAAAAFGRAA
jgi:hypothetical protein